MSPVGSYPVSARTSSWRDGSAVGHDCSVQGVGQLDVVLHQGATSTHHGADARAVEAVCLDAGGRNQLGQLDVQGACNLRCQHQSHVLTAALDTAHVGAVDAGLMRERLLGQTERKASLANGRTERHQLWCLSISRGRTRHSVIVDS